MNFLGHILLKLNPLWSIYAPFHWMHNFSFFCLSQDVSRHKEAIQKTSKMYLKYTSFPSDAHLWLWNILFPFINILPTGGWPVCSIYICSFSPWFRDQSLTVEIPPLLGLRIFKMSDTWQFLVITKPCCLAAPYTSARLFWGFYYHIQPSFRTPFLI